MADDLILIMALRNALFCIIVYYKLKTFLSKVKQDRVIEARGDTTKQYKKRGRV